MISRDEAYDLAYRLRNTYIIVPNQEVKPVKISTPIEKIEVMRYTSPIFQKAADVIEELIDALIDVCAENSAYEVANEILKEKLERANHCINEISDQFERGKCSNDYVEEILKEYYENE